MVRDACPRGFLFLGGSAQYQYDDSYSNYEQVERNWFGDTNKRVKQVHEIAEEHYDGNAQPH